MPTNRRPLIADCHAWHFCLRGWHIYMVCQDLRVDSPRSPYHRDSRGALCGKAAENKQLMETAKNVTTTTHPKNKTERRALVRTPFELRHIYLRMPLLEQTILPFPTHVGAPKVDRSSYCACIHTSGHNEKNRKTTCTLTIFSIRPKDSIGLEKRLQCVHTGA